MQKFAFSLERMRNYKEQMLNKEKNTLKRLRARRDGILDQIEQLHQYRLLKNRELQRRQSEGMNASELSAHRFFIENTQLQSKGLKAELVKAEEEVERQLRIVVTASQEIAGLDKLEEKQLEEYRYNEAKATEINMSEIITSDIVRKRLEDLISHKDY